MTRYFVLSGWVLVLAFVVMTEVISRRSHGRYGTLAAVRDRIMRPLPVYVITFVGWLWLGWHFFAR